MFTIFMVGATFFLIGICVGIRAEYRNGYLDRRLHKPWPVPKPVITDDFIDDCHQFNVALLRTPFEQRVIETSETIQ